ncbi:SLATT domain-containing protein [Pseudoalteromonas rubra]|uniref:SLATT domain-containing protein n=1 Tax=Pseudoalteromonas rubra TaxID=43658 RepID=A0A5S3UYQ0_9GAMM|nr:SLATT domain-containing protein [Pseudoalteromonas rubra]QPB85281.1 SLATT domain-containing protein [Pseudoalteromonas rubra]
MDIQAIKKRMKTTAYAKFDAHKRYERLNNTSLFALTSASLLLIFIGIFSKYALDLCPAIKGELIELFSIVVSIIILVLSLVVSFASFTLKSERCLKVGNDIIDLIDRLDITTSDEESRNIINEYATLRKNADNHQRFNYARGRAERKLEKTNQPLSNTDKPSWWNWIEYWAPIIAFYLISAISLIIFSIMIYYCIKYA